MLRYNPHLKKRAQQLRKTMTDAERRLWRALRHKQILDVLFYRQKPIGNYIVDFYAPKAKLVIEVDGSQHLSVEHKVKDSRRDAFLALNGLKVLRFDNLQVLTETDSVMEKIFTEVKEMLRNPP